MKSHPEHWQCMEVWGGNQVVDDAVKVAGLDAWVYSKPCGGDAVIEIRRHRAAFCRDCFLHHCHEQVRRAISSHRMMGHSERILVAISGGKDSLALWDILLELGYTVDGE